jgi:hypothetical protein
MPKQPRELARDASAAIRELNHATMDPASMPYAGEISATVLALIELTERLTQTLPQLHKGLRLAEACGQIRLDHDGYVATEVDAALQGLTDACNALGEVHKGLSAASAPLFHMGAPSSPDDDED